MSDPTLKIRYATGLGDLIACTLHSRWLGWLTKLISGKSRPCSVCSQRILKLNKKIPLPIWRFFYKSIEDRTDAMVQDLEKNGYTYIAYQDGSILASKTVIEDENLLKLNVSFNEKGQEFSTQSVSREDRQIAREALPFIPDELNNPNVSPHAENIYRYMLVSSQESEISNEYLVRTQIFKIV